MTTRKFNFKDECLCYSEVLDGSYTQCQREIANANVVALPGPPSIAKWWKNCILFFCATLKTWKIERRDNLISQRVAQQSNHFVMLFNTFFFRFLFDFFFIRWSDGWLRSFLHTVLTPSVTHRRNFVSERAVSAWHAGRAPSFINITGDSLSNFELALYLQSVKSVQMYRKSRQFISTLSIAERDGIIGESVNR